MTPKKIHFIALGGSAMHNLAIALHKKGYCVTGSDDEIFDPSKSRLAQYNLLPAENGWHPERITNNTDAVILGMHAKKDNPELKQAQRLGVPVYSYPEYLYNQTKNKTRIAIAGSHGKTTTTAMVMHVLKYAGISFDYMVGASLEGFETMVNLETKNEIAVFEADEYLSSPVDMRSKFLWYKPHIAVITGIAWDHINVFPTFEEYLETFQKFLDTIAENGQVFYFGEDEHLQKLAQNHPPQIEMKPYKGFEHTTDNKISINNLSIEAPVFGAHNLQNMKAAYLIIKALGVDDNTFNAAMQHFKGASRRLQILKDGANPVYFDFAHAPSKVKATLQAVREKHPDKKILACLELHTFSSLNRDFIPHYQHTMQPADNAIVYFNPDTLKHKGMPALELEFIQTSFEHRALSVLTASEKVMENIPKFYNEGYVVLIMTSGNFNGVDFKQWADTL